MNPTFNPQSPRGLDDFPSEVIQKIIGYLKCGEVKTLRLLNRRFDALCSHVLNRMFKDLGRKIDQKLSLCRPTYFLSPDHQKRQDAVAKCFVLEALKSEYSLLRAVFWRPIGQNICCFFPGEVLDSFHHVLELLEGQVENDMTSKLATIFYLDSVLLKKLHKYTRPISWSDSILECVAILGACPGNRRTNSFDVQGDTVVSSTKFWIRFLSYFGINVKCELKLRKRYKLKDLPRILGGLMSEYSSYAYRKKARMKLLDASSTLQYMAACECHVPWGTQACACRQCYAVSLCEREFGDDLLIQQLLFPTAEFEFFLHVPLDVMNDLVWSRPSTSSQVDLEECVSSLGKQDLPENVSFRCKIVRNELKLCVNLRLVKRRSSVTSLIRALNCIECCTSGDSTKIRSHSKTDLSTS